MSEPSTGYNWIDTLVHFASISGVLAGFCVAFIALIIGGQVGDVDICTSGITFGRMSVLFFGIPAVLFVFASQRFLHAHEFNIWNLPHEYYKFVKKKVEDQKKRWEDFLLESDATCRKYETEGSASYNAAVIFMLVGLFLIVFPYNLVIALIVGVLGLLLELLQYVR